MRAAYLSAPGKFDIRHVPTPQPSVQEALIRVERCGICGTDLHMFHGAYAQDQLPLVPGHEFAGTVAAVGAQVTHFSVGQTCVVDMNLGCGHCFFCRRNEVLNCADRQQLGITRDGAFADHILVPARQVIPVEGIRAAVLALAEPLSCVVRSARKAQIAFGSSALVLGAGPIGNFYIQLLRTIGAAPLMVAEVSPGRAALAKAAGADVVVTDPDQLDETVLQWTQGRGADLVIECVGAAALYENAQRLMRRGGRLVAFGLAPDDAALSLGISDTILREDSLSASVAGQGQDLHDALTLLRHGRIDPQPFLGATYPLEQIQEAFDTYAERPQDLKTQIVLSSP